MDRTEQFETSLDVIKPFMANRQRIALRDIFRGEESDFALETVVRLAKVINDMPSTYEGGAGREAMVHLHYFRGSADWHITEKDMESEQIQAFGMADLGYGSELGYISIEEITKAGIELDIHWEPTLLSEIKGQKELAAKSLKVYQCNLSIELVKQVNSLGWNKAAEKYPLVDTYLNKTYGTAKFKTSLFEHFEHVANVGTEDLEKAFDALNGHNDDVSVERLLPMSSLSVGDILVGEDGVAHMVDSMGFEVVEIEDSEIKVEESGMGM